MIQNLKCYLTLFIGTICLLCLLTEANGQALAQANDFDKTITQIKTLEHELKQNQKIIEQKIAELRATNPLYAEKGMFESDVEYLARIRASSFGENLDLLSIHHKLCLT